MLTCDTTELLCGYNIDIVVKISTAISWQPLFNLVRNHCRCGLNTWLTRKLVCLHN